MKKSPFQIIHTIGAYELRKVICKLNRALSHSNITHNSVDSGDRGYDVVRFNSVFIFVFLTYLVFIQLRPASHFTHCGNASPVSDDIDVPPGMEWKAACF